MVYTYKTSIALHINGIFAINVPKPFVYFEFLLWKRTR